MFYSLLLILELNRLKVPSLFSFRLNTQFKKLWLVTQDYLQTLSLIKASLDFKTRARQLFSWVNGKIYQIKYFLMDMMVSWSKYALKDKKETFFHLTHLV